MSCTNPSFTAVPDSSSLLHQLREHLDRLPKEFEHFRAPLEQGVTPGQLRGLTSEEYASLYRIACQLCDAGDFQQALIIALQLVFNDPASSRYAFLSASCLQRTGQIPFAALLYARTLDLDACHAAAAYRLGECLTALHQPAEARAMFETSIDLSRGNLARRELMLMAEQALLDR